MSQTEVQLIKSSSVVDGDIVGMSSSKLSGALPAISGASLTNLPSTGKAKNLVVNGAMNIAQRETSNSVINGIATVDRFMVIRSGVDENPTQSQVDVAAGTTPYTLGFRKAYRVTNGNQTSVGTGDYISMRYQFEAQDIAKSGWNYLSSSSNITLSFWVKSSVAQNFYGYFETQDGTQYAYPFETGSLSADTWTKVTKTIPGNSNLTFDNDPNNGLRIYITQFWGTDKTGSVTLNQWGAYNTNLRMPNFTSTWYTTDNATFEITGVQLEVGDSATDFEHLSEGEDLRRCLRYYFKIGYGTQYANVCIGIMANSTQFRATVTWPAPMRAAPTLTQSGLDVDSETASAPAITGFNSQYSDRFTGRIQFTNNTASFGAGQVAMAYTGSATAYLAGEAEL